MPSMSSIRLGAASTRGTPINRNSTSTIRPAAQPGERRSFSRSKRKAGHVEYTRMPAHSSAEMKGRSTRKHPMAHAIAKASAAISASALAGVGVTVSCSIESRPLRARPFRAGS